MEDAGNSHGDYEQTGDVGAIEAYEYYRSQCLRTLHGLFPKRRARSLDLDELFDVVEDDVWAAQGFEPGSVADGSPAQLQQMLRVITRITSSWCRSRVAFTASVRLRPLDELLGASRFQHWRRAGCDEMDAVTLRQWAYRRSVLIRDGELTSPIQPRGVRCFTDEELASMSPEAIAEWACRLIVPLYRDLCRLRSRPEYAQLDQTTRRIADEMRTEGLMRALFGDSPVLVHERWHPTVAYLCRVAATDLAKLDVITSDEAIALHQWASALE